MAAPSASDESLQGINKTLHAMSRPRLFFDIAPDKNESGLLYVYLRNLGGSPAYRINVKFSQPLYYYEDQTLSDLPLFKNLPFLEHGREISFFFRDFASVIQEGNASGPKRTRVTLTYSDIYTDPDTSGEPTFTETYDIDLLRYKGILSVQSYSLNDAVKELSLIRRGLERLIGKGLLVRTPADVEKERRAFENNMRENKSRK